jgi:hypothetical protein
MTNRKAATMTTHDPFDSDPLASARLRAGDADRERTADELRRAHTDGRIDSDELSERIGRCYESRTYGELQRLTADLVRPERRGSLHPYQGGRFPRHRLQIALAAIAALWVVAVAAHGGPGHAHLHPHPFAFLVLLAFAFLITRLVRAVRA